LKESRFHEWLKSVITPGPGVELGIGDDAAVLGANGPVAAASDMLVEDVHYDRAEADPAGIGAKAVNRSLSDMAAMGLEPKWILASAAVPAGTDDAFLKKVFLSAKEAGARFGAVLVGGDTVRSPGPLVIDVTVLGPLGGLKPVTRSGASPGDRIFVTGDLGGSILGKHLAFSPRVKEGLFLNNHHRPTAMIDLSDGLERDLCRLLDASGAGAEVDGERIPVSKAAHELSGATGRDPLDHALHDGEDFELLFTLPPDEAGRLLDDGDLFFPVTDIGVVVVSGRRVIRLGDEDFHMKGIGFDHQL